MNIVVKIFKYISPLWTGEDGKISLRACIAIGLTIKLVENLDYAIQKWDSGRSLGDASSIFFTLAGLIAALLGITAWSNMTAKKIETEAFNPPNPTTVIQNAESVVSTGTTKAQVVNTDNIETVNTNNISNKSDNIPGEENLKV